jgi:hypothetical protein
MESAPFPDGSPTEKRIPFGNRHATTLLKKPGAEIKVFYPESGKGSHLLNHPTMSPKPTFINEARAFRFSSAERSPGITPQTKVIRGKTYEKTINNPHWVIRGDPYQSPYLYDEMNGEMRPAPHAEGLSAEFHDLVSPLSYTITPAEVLEAEQRTSVELAAMGVSFRRTGVLSWVNGRLDPKSPHRFPVYRVESGGAFANADVGTRALQHPRLPVYLDRLKSVGGSLLVDSSLGVSYCGSAGYLLSQSRSVVIKPQTTWNEFIHEFSHLDFTLGRSALERAFQWSGRSWKSVLEGNPQAISSRDEEKFQRVAGIHPILLEARKLLQETGLCSENLLSIDETIAVRRQMELFEGEGYGPNHPMVLHFREYALEWQLYEGIELIRKECQTPGTHSLKAMKHFPGSFLPESWNGRFDREKIEAHLRGVRSELRRLRGIMSVN